MYGVVIEFPGNNLRDVAGRFARAEGETLSERRDELRGGMRSLVGILRQEAPKRSGGFANSIGFLTTVQDGVLQGHTYAASPMNRWIKEGTPPHRIVARNAQALAFEWGKAGGGVHFFKAVNHPGTAPNPYDERALEIWLPQADPLLRKMARSYIAFIAQ